MVSGSNAAGPALRVTVPPESVEALERLRDSYNGLLQREALMEVDLAVLVAVQFILKQIKKPHQPLR
jgi:hypothetical protein